MALLRLINAHLALHLSLALVRAPYRIRRRGLFYLGETSARVAVCVCRDAPLACFPALDVM